MATGYIAISRRFGSQANEFHLTIDDTIDNLGKAVLGLSISCARCHDHKFDPIPNRDYYSLYGIFNSTRYAFPGTEIYRHTKDFVPLAVADKGQKLVKWQDELGELDARLQRLNNERMAIERKDKKPKAAADKPGAASISDDKTAGRTLADVDTDLARVKLRITELENQPPGVEKAYAVSDGKPADARILRKGDPNDKGDEAPRGFLQILGGQRLPEPEKGSGRLELAQWLTDTKNPLTARVMVNRIWQHHFGKGLVQTPNDFGARGKAPTHPELLDYLAARFIESGWSVKAMHRLIVLSHAYRLSSADSPQNASVDVNNDLLWKFNRRRLDAEEIRDAMLTVGGAIDLTMPGPHPFPPEGSWRYTQHQPFIADFPTNHRSVYLMQQRIKRQPFLEAFDGADPNAPTAERSLSTTPIQALQVMNDPFVHEQADNFAVRVGMAYGNEARRIDYSYRLAFGRPPTKEELKIGAEYLGKISQEIKQTKIPADRQPRAALASYLRILMSSNEFMFVD
ncbi:MAG TPA: DUF1553 domain-containing protein [Blastocatellia bacterium]|nr:DUF1553 domain-containing protein [Blastocatellia bacterium]